MRAMMAYMAMRNRGENQQDGNRQPNRSMGEGWHEDNDGMEMRRRRDEKGRFMESYDEDEVEDVRAYQARNEYRQTDENYGRAENRRGMNERYIRPMMPTNGLYDGGGIGFGTRDREYQTRSHYGGDEYGGDQRQAVQAGGTFWMMPNRNSGEKLDRMTAERWVRGMRNEDSARPSGGKWTMEELKPMAQKFGIDTDPESEEFLEFWVMTNAMYSDYCGVAKKFNITSPEFYGMMAKAWRDDKDAMPNKTALYYEHIVKKNN